MGAEYIVFIILVAGAVIGAARLGEKVYTLRRKVQSPATRLLLNSWLIWCLFLAAFVLFVLLLVFGGRLFPGIGSYPWYRWLLVGIFGFITWGSLIMLELAWRRLVR